MLMNVIDDLSKKIRRDNRIMGDLRQVCPPGRWTHIIKDVDSKE
jgi:Tfp pilus assembly protein PilN